MTVLEFNRDFVEYENKLREEKNMTLKTMKPGYKARDVDFKSALAQAMTGTGSDVVNLTRTDEHHMPASTSVRIGNELYRVPLQPDTGDGNTVDVNVERANFLENALMYQTSLEFLNQKISQLSRALKGEQ